MAVWPFLMHNKCPIKFFYWFEFASKGAALQFIYASNNATFRSLFDVHSISNCSSLFLTLPSFISYPPILNIMKFLIILSSMNSFIDFHRIDRSRGCNWKLHNRIINRYCHSLEIDFMQNCINNCRIVIWNTTVPTIDTISRV